MPPLRPGPGDDDDDGACLSLVLCLVLAPGSVPDSEGGAGTHSVLLNRSIVQFNAAITVQARCRTTTDWGPSLSVCFPSRYEFSTCVKSPPPPIIPRRPFNEGNAPPAAVRRSPAVAGYCVSPSLLAALRRLTAAILDGGASRRTPCPASSTHRPTGHRRAPRPPQVSTRPPRAPQRRSTFQPHGWRAPCRAPWRTGLTTGIRLRGLSLVPFSPQFRNFFECHT